MQKNIDQPVGFKIFYKNFPIILILQKKRICWSSKFKLAAKSESLKLCWLYRAAPMYIHTGEENKYISQMKKKQLKNIPSKIDVHNTQLTQAEWCL